MRYRQATSADTALLAELNRQLIDDEGSGHQAALSDLTTHIKHWLTTDHKAALFEQDDQIVAYAIYREQPDAVYLRQFFVDRRYRRQGIGRRAIQLLLSEVWPHKRRVVVE